MMNSGKKLEARIKLACSEQGIDCTRLKDAGWQGEQTERRFTSKNICDFILFRSPFLFFVEAKSRKSSLRFDGITQAKELRKKHNPEGNIHAGVLCELNNRIFWISIVGIDNAERMLGKKSFNANDAAIYGREIHTIVPPKKREARIDLGFI